MEKTKEKRSEIMRLYNIFYICKSCLPNIKAIKTREVVNDSNVVLIRNWGE